MDRTGSRLQAGWAGSASLESRDFDVFRLFLQRVCGIYLAENKRYLVETRIRRILAEQGLTSLGELVQRIQNAHQATLRSQVVDAMTTNETYWFRDNYPFLLLRRDIFPRLMAAPTHLNIRVWSAACSFGQEPYSVSMMAEECQKAGLNKGGRQVEILATDLSGRVLQRARAAEYDRLSIVRGLSPRQLQDHFLELPGESSWRIRDNLRRRVSFKPFNLLDSFSPLGKFDIVFCRNVLIYFSADLKQDILRRLHAVLRPGGILFLGASEGIASVTDLFETVQANPGIYYRAC